MLIAQKAITCLQQKHHTRRKIMKQLLILAILTSFLSITDQIHAAAHSKPGQLVLARQEQRQKQSFYETESDKMLFQKVYWMDEKSVLRLLDDEKANVNARTTDDGSTPLMALMSVPAANPQAIPIARILLTRKADANAKNNNGANAFMFATCYRNKDLAQLLIDEGFNDFESATNDGLTPLILAAQNACPEVVKILLGKKVNVNTKDSQGYTALTHAAQKLNALDPSSGLKPHYEEIIRDLMEAGAEVDPETVQKYPAVEKLVEQKLSLYMNLMKDLHTVTHDTNNCPNTTKELDYWPFSSL